MNRTAPQKQDRTVIRFAGDSGDGMQLLGHQFTQSSAMLGNDIATFPDFPAEIRAPAGTREGVSGFQIQFADHDIFTPGDVADVLVAMNPAALITNVQGLRQGGLVIVNTDKFKAADLKKARLESSPLEDGTLDGFRVLKAPISDLTKGAVEPFGLNTKQADRCKNFFALGMMYWLYERDSSLTEKWIQSKFRAPYSDANLAALRAGVHYADTVEMFQTTYKVEPAEFPEGTYRNIMGNTALAVGLVAAAQRAGTTLFYGTYPITPASDILHALAPFKNYGVVTFQAEDEIAGICSAIGAAWGGALGVTGTSGPGLALKGEALGLAMSVELPLIVIDVQRGGPSTGLPTKTEQSDLFQAMYGRNGEAPLPVIAPRSPSDCFDCALKAVELAFRFMVPVVILSDGYIANGAEPWLIPNLSTLPNLRPEYRTDPEGFQPYLRNDDLARPWVVPGTAGMEHRIGGLEKQHETGNVSYDPANHQFMSEVRAQKVKNIQKLIPESTVHGDPDGLLVLAWGSTFGAVRTAVDQARERGHRVAHVHIRYLNPLPPDLGDILSRYERVLVPELNMGQLAHILRAEFLVDARPLSKIQGQPFKTTEVLEGILSHVQPEAH